MDDSTDPGFDWSPLGEAWWREAAETFKASERQLRFAAAKHRGCSHTGAAREAGYGTGETVRQVASRAAQTRIVRSLLAFAEAEVGRAGKNGAETIVDAHEAKRILSSLARNADPTIRIRAVEGLSRLDDREVELGRAPDSDGFAPWRVVRDHLQLPNGGTAIMLMWVGEGNTLASLPLLHDVRNRVIAEGYGDLWERIRSGYSQSTRVWLDAHVNDPEWQLEARRQLWKEIGIDIDASTEQTVVRKSNGAATPEIGERTEHA
jgi:hypothetical protein